MSSSSIADARLVEEGNKAASESIMSNAAGEEEEAQGTGKETTAKLDYDALLQGLDGVEQEILYIIEAAQATVEELAGLPHACNYDNVAQLSKAFMKLVHKSSGTLKSTHSQLMSEALPEGVSYEQIKAELLKQIDNSNPNSGERMG